jgi:ferredoxin-NADP reductase
LVSGHVAERVGEGQSIRAQAPAGRFTVDPDRGGPLVLLGGGIGVTPLVSVLNAVAASGVAREVWLFLGFRDRTEHPFKPHLERMAREHESIHLHVAYSRPRPEDQAGRDYQHPGRVTLDLIKRELPPADEPYDFYVCGPTGMMEEVGQGLTGLGVPPSRVHIESFGASSMRPRTRRLNRKLAQAGAQIEVEFARSQKTVAWKPESGTLLELAMANDVFFPFACAVGHCGTCATRLLDGRVAYPEEPSFPVREGKCLPCVASPATSVVLDV